MNATLTYLISPEPKGFSKSLTATGVINATAVSEPVAVIQTAGDAYTGFCELSPQMHMLWKILGNETAVKV